MALSILGSLLVAALASGCGSSHNPGDDDDSTGDDDDDDRCDTLTMECFATDALGCCGTSATVTISICDACPENTVPRSGCNTSCEDPCNDTPGTSGGSAGDAEEPSGAAFPAARCVEDLGGGCCGDVVFGADMCGRCPPGSRYEYECAATFPDCDCGGVDGDEPGGGAPADPVPAPPADAGAADPATGCFRNLGEGCCGTEYTAPGRCGCPEGFLTYAECTDHVGSDAEAPVPVAPVCRRTYGVGCCGEEVARNACSGECPEGSVEDSECTASLGGGAGFVPPDPGDDGDRPAPPPPPAECRKKVGTTGCCGEVVPVNSCTGDCGPEAVYSFECTGFAPACT